LSLQTIQAEGEVQPLALLWENGRKRSYNRPGACRNTLGLAAIVGYVAAQSRHWRSVVPQLFALALLGAGALAATRWVAKQVTAAKEAADAAEAQLRRAAERANAPKDVGQLEWDEVAQVYKPRS
jgi:hypothetical protein